MGPLFKYLKDEHGVILQKDAELEELVYSLDPENPQKVDLLKSCIDFFVQEVCGRHYKEEELYVFSPIATHPKLSEGGPKCILFKGMFENNKFHEKVEDFIEQNSDDNFDVQLSPDMQKLFDERNPLRVPLSEHIASEKALLFLKRELELFESGEISTLTNFKKMGLIFIKLLEYHGRKEDECLFQLSDSLLSHEDQESLLKQIQSEKC